MTDRSKASLVTQDRHRAMVMADNLLSDVVAIEHL